MRGTDCGAWRRGGGGRGVRKGGGEAGLAPGGWGGGGTFNLMPTLIVWGGSRF